MSFILNSAPTCLYVCLHLICFQNHTENSEKEKNALKNILPMEKAASTFTQRGGGGAYPWLQQELRAQEKGFETLTQSFQSER